MTPEIKLIFPRNDKYIKGKTMLFDQQISLLINIFIATNFLLIAALAAIYTPEQRMESIGGTVFIALVLTAYLIKFAKMFLLSMYGKLYEGAVTKVEPKSWQDVDGCQINFFVDDESTSIQGVVDSPRSFVVGDKVAVVVFEGEYIVL